MKTKLMISAILAATIVILSTPPTCAGSITDQLCLSIVNFLNNEAAKTNAAVKSCKDKCTLTKKKQELIAAAQKKANNSCAKGIAPDLTKISEGLDKNVQEKLNKLYNSNGSRLFDGTADHPDKDFNADFSNAAALTGKGGQVADLKAADPVLDKIASATEFGIKPLKSAAAAGSSCPAYTIPSCAELPLFMQGVDQDIASAKTAIEAWEGMSDSEEKQLRLAEWRAWLKCMEDEKAAVVAATAGCGKCSASQDLVNGNCVPKCSGGQTRNAAGTCECSAGKELVNGNCEPKCSGGQIRNVAGTCECSAGKELVNGNCVPKCSGGQIRNATGTCECPAGQTLTAGKCSFSGGSGGTSSGNGFIETVKGWVDNIKLLGDWITGRGDKERHYGPDDRLTKDMQSAQTVQKAREEYQGEKIVKYENGLSALLSSGLNRTTTSGRIPTHTNS